MNNPKRDRRLSCPTIYLLVDVDIVEDVHGYELIKCLFPVHKKMAESGGLPNSKNYQERIIAHTKGNDLVGIIGILGELSRLPSCTDWLVSVGKMAVNISANLVGGSHGVSEPQLHELHTYVETLIRCTPSLGAMESVEYSYAKIKLSVGLLDSALQLALDSKEPRLRIFSSILEHCAAAGNYAVALSLLDSIGSRGLVPTELDFANVVRSMSGMDDSLVFVSTFSDLLDRIADAVEAGPLASEDLVTALVSTLEQQGINLHSEVIVPDSGASSSICPVTGLKLDVVPLTEIELEEMLELTRRLVVESCADGEKSLQLLESIIVSSEEFPTVFLDGANIAHTNQNFEEGFFRFDQVADIANHFVSVCI